MTSSHSKVPWEGLIARNLKTNGGVCDAAVMPTGYWDKMRAGVYAEMDCTDNTTACKRDSTGVPELGRDCGYVLVGGIVTQVLVPQVVVGFVSPRICSRPLVMEHPTAVFAQPAAFFLC